MDKEENRLQDRADWAVAQPFDAINIIDEHEATIARLTAELAEARAVVGKIEQWREEVLHNAAGDPPERVNEILDGIDSCLEAAERANGKVEHYGCGLDSSDKEISMQEAAERAKGGE